MSIRCISIALGAGAAIALGAVWTNPAQAFTFKSPVIVENFLRIRDPENPTSPPEDFSFQGPTTVVVSHQDLSRVLSQSPGQSSGGNKPLINISPDGADQGPELYQFGGIWDIYLGNNSILLKLNSRFGNVISGDDVYVFLAPDLKGSIKEINHTAGGSSTFARPPAINPLAGNKFEVVFPLGFAPGDSPDLTKIPGGLELYLELIIEPTPVPTPALLPGLVGLGLAVLRGRRSDSEG